MTPLPLLPLALAAAQPQTSSGAADLPTVETASATAQPQTATPGQPAADIEGPSAPSQDRRNSPPELADSLVDPAKQPTVETPLQVGHHYPGDSLEKFNRTMFRIQMSLDKSIYRPLAMGYKHVVPKPARAGLRNFFRNLSEPIIFLNDILQLKLGAAARTFARFAINSTVGIGGLIDVAASKGVNLPHHNNGFGNTLAYYGVHSGSYLFLPLVGPTTLRDFAGEPVDGAVLPLTIGKPFTEIRYTIISGAIMGLDLRAEADPEMRALFAGAVDPYATLRSVWLQNRAAEISQLHRHEKAQPVPELQDPLQDPANRPASTPVGHAPEEPMVAPTAATGPQ